MINYWGAPVGVTASGRPIFGPLEDGDIIPFRRQRSPSSSNDAESPPLASAHLLYIREIITRIAHMMGAAGYSEYDYWSDDDDDVSVLASERSGSNDDQVR